MRCPGLSRFADKVPAQFGQFLKGGWLARPKVFAMTQFKPEQNTDGQSIPLGHEKLVVDVSVALYEDAQNSNLSLLGSALTTKAETPEQFQSIQMALKMFGEKQYPEPSLVKQPLALDQTTVQAVLANPLTKQALPYATLGYLYDKFDEIHDPNSKIDRITPVELSKYIDGKTDANPMERALLKYAADNIVAISDLAGQDLTRSALKSVAEDLHGAQRRADLSDDMKYLQTNFFDIEKRAPGGGITAPDIAKKRSITVDLNEQRRLDSIERHIDALSDFNTTDGGVRGSLLRYAPPQRCNAQGVTSRDIETWQRNNQILNRFNLKADSDPSVQNYYSSVKAMQKSPSIADQIWPR